MTPTQISELHQKLLLETLKRCYRKHHMDADDIGWHSLADEIGNTLAEVMGDREFQRFVEENTK